jgi:tetratricopeptide (TPR) repeat protein
MRWTSQFLIGLITILIPLAGLKGQGIETYPDLSKCSSWTTTGSKLSAEEAGKLENQIASNPGDMESRIKLLGYYWHPRISREDARKAAQVHILWLIQNKPASYAATDPTAQILKILDAKRYQECADLWESQLKKHPDSALVIGNAAQFYLLNDRQRSETLFKRAAELQPDNSFWQEKLGRLYALQAEHGQALAALEKAAEKQPDSEHFYLLDDLAWEAFKSGNYSKAETYAKKLLEAANKHTNDWNQGNAIYYGNSVLGLLALQKKDTNQARQYLLAAGESKGSPQLNSFGPNMLLAQKLLETGEKETVLQHLDQLAKFWQSGRDNLAKWKEQIRHGETPKFKTR